MISKFFPAGHLILIFMYKKNINSPPPPQRYLSFSRRKSFLQQILFHEVNIGFGGTVFS